MINLQRPLTCPFWRLLVVWGGPHSCNGYGYEVGSGSGWGYTHGSGFGLYPQYAILELKHVAT